MTDSPAVLFYVSPGSFGLLKKDSVGVVDQCGLHIFYYLTVSEEVPVICVTILDLLKAGQFWYGTMTRIQGIPGFCHSRYERKTVGMVTLSPKVEPQSINYEPMLIRDLMDSFGYYMNHQSLFVERSW